MELLGKIKRLLGIGRASEESRAPAETSVTVERERDPEPDAESEAAVKGETEEVDAAPGGESTPSTEGTEAEAEEPVSADTDASGSTESIVDEDEASERPTDAAEPAEAAGPGTDEVDTDEEVGTADEDTDGVASSGGSVSVDELKGIGPAYAERLSEMGIDTVADLADADAAEVAEGIDVSEKRVARWIDRANEYDE